MLVINRLTKAGEVKRVLLKSNEVVVTLIDKQMIIYRREVGDTDDAPKA